jgi:hypothetical protein
MNPSTQRGKKNPKKTPKTTKLMRSREGSGGRGKQHLLSMYLPKWIPEQKSVKRETRKSRTFNNFFIYSNESFVMKCER